MRAKFDNSFCDFLLRVGDGKEPVVMDDKIRIPHHMLLLPYVNDDESLETLLSTVFPRVNAYVENVNEMMRRAILTPRNDFVDDINEKLIKTFPGTTRVYKSFDQTLDSNEQGLYEDFLHTLTPNRLSPHILILKPNCPIMLLRNIDPPEGLSNDTRLIG